ncbi:SWIM zinc finger family protein [Kineococcus sp. LSe6-4]|uniref:SWIM zinc finger family protein n=1 Tax=Kineococcus halophytocola TaxID=3234027 RepID=A0ABV4GYJ8_9ACTN
MIESSATAAAHSSVRESEPSPGSLRLETGLGVGPFGVLANPRFFQGFLEHPVAAARGLLAVAAVARARYSTGGQAGFRDPVVTADGTSLRFESFSSCCGVHARLDLLPDGLDGETAQRGTTNVDVNLPLQRALALVGDRDRLHVAVGPEDLTVTTPTASVTEAKVALPPRWVRGFAEAAVSLARMDLRAEVPAAEARRFLRALPRGARQQTLWVVPAGRGLRTATRPVPGAVCLAGPRRLEALNALLPLATTVRLHGPPVTGRPTASAWEIDLPGARLTLVLSPEPAWGFSGEGGVLEVLAAVDPADDTARVLDLLSWVPGLPLEDVADALALDAARTRRALVELGTSGRVGYDLAVASWFHRELPFDPARAACDNPRLRTARALVAEGAVHERPDGVVVVRRPDGERRVRRAGTGFSCTCPWWIEHTGARGPCKHVLAARIVLQARTSAPAPAVVS